MNWKEIGEVVKELKQLENASVSRSYQPEKDTIVFELRHNQRNHFLLISVADDLCRLHLVDRKPKNPRVPYGFVSLLRAHLEPSRIVEIAQLDKDRVVEIKFESFTENKTSSYSLVCELTGRHANAFLLDSDNIILGIIRRNHSKKRKLVPLSSYLKPVKAEAVEAKIRYGISDAEFPHNEAAQLFFGKYAAKYRQETKKKKLLSHIKGRLKKIGKTEKALNRDFEKTKNSARYRLWADLLQINFSALKKGMEQIVIVDMVSGSMTDVEVRLDPKLAPQKNISRLYEKAKKLERGGPKILERLEQIADEKDHFERLLELLNEDDSAEVVNRLSEKLGLKNDEQHNVTKKTQKFDKNPPFRRFFSQTGFEIRVGRSAVENDKLTFGMSKGDDFWFHASGYAGSHVVVPLKPNTDIDQQTLIDAATLAAHYSKARGGSVEVAYTRIRYIRKPSKRQAGQVIFSRHKSLFINPEEERIRRLMSE